MGFPVILIFIAYFRKIHIEETYWLGSLEQKSPEHQRKLGQLIPFSVMTNIDRGSVTEGYSAPITYVNSMQLTACSAGHTTTRNFCVSLIRNLIAL